MMKTFVVLGLGAVIVFSPLAAVAQSATGRLTPAAAALTVDTCAIAATRTRREPVQELSTCA